MDRADAHDAGQRADINSVRTGTLLCRSDFERGRLLALSDRLRRVEYGAMSLVVAASVAATPAFGWRPVIPLAVVAAAYAWSRPRLARFRRPEYVIAANWLFAEVMVACAVALARGPRLLILPVFCFPMMLGSVVFPRRAVAAGAAIAAALMVATALIVSAGTVAHTPPTLVYPLVMLVCTAIWAEAASAAEAASRGRR